ncbi:hypothetical protein KVG88_30330 [Pseudomonas sp. SWRI74]|uniref:Transposase n=1 Tax=Pseudomonas azerbaijanoccidentalis TaxID=2842347 RepID=A0ABS6QZK6_9PSED|nr:hypothetical protein [Pseudomonas azerbaijanoccidentalis]MBV4524374.1 hypothetical protein [Pseudomonas azerbaijanoccidentalis]
MIPEVRFYLEVRKFALTEPSYSTRRQVVRSFPSERYHLQMMALRVYGDAAEVLAIRAAAGLSTVDSPLEEQDVVLPTKEHLAYLKQKSGIVAAVRSVR